MDPALSGAVSLALFKPTKIIKFFWEECERDWDAAKVAAMREQSSQGELFADEQWRRTFRLMQKLPFNFSYHFEDADGRESKLRSCR